MAPPSCGNTDGPRTPTPAFRAWVSSLDAAQQAGQDATRGPAATARDSWWRHPHMVETGPRFKTVRVAAWSFALVMVGAAAFAVVNAKMERAYYTRLDMRGS